MKKLLLVAILGIAGIVSAKKSNLEFEKSIDSKEKEYFSSDLYSLMPLLYDWVKVTTGCGKVFYLDNDHYGDCYECLQEDARYFTDAQCGTGNSFEVPF